MRCVARERTRRDGDLRPHGLAGKRPRGVRVIGQNQLQAARDPSLDLQAEVDGAIPPESQTLSGLPSFGGGYPFKEAYKRINLSLIVWVGEQNDPDTGFGDTG